RPLLARNPRFDGVIPVPQRATRSWALGGSLTERIAAAVSMATGIPIIRALRPGTRREWADGSRTGAPIRRQSELDLRGRLENRLHFRISREWEERWGFPE